MEGGSIDTVAWQHHTGCLSYIVVGVFLVNFDTERVPFLGTPDPPHIPKGAFVLSCHPVLYRQKELKAMRREAAQKDILHICTAAAADASIAVFEWHHVKRTNVNSWN